MSRQCFPERRMSLRSRLGAALLAAVVCSLALGAAAPAGPTVVQGDGMGQLGLVGVDHVGITVPDIGVAVEWFEDVLGCNAPLTFGPFG
ncbi:MAG TPA: hypothetical protein VI540_01285, partial [Gaiellaceae bacterium]|nr:hypothetical protein [Gaiellaceae bacterium]